MQMLSVVGVRTSEGKRTTIVQQGSSNTHSFQRLFSSFWIKTLCLFFFSCTFLFFQVKNYEWAIRLQGTLTQLVAPLPYYLSKPGQWMREMEAVWVEKNELIKENLVIKTQMEELKRSYQQVLHHKEENINLRRALQVQSGLLMNVTTVEISHRTFDGFSESYYTLASNVPIEKNSPVLSIQGQLIGRIVNNKSSSASEKNKFLRIMPLTDPASRVPVKIEGTDVQGILKGKNKTLELHHIENADQIKPGVVLVTSGVGGIFPAGIPVAVTTQNTRNVHQALPLALPQEKDFALILTPRLPR